MSIAYSLVYNSYVIGGASVGTAAPVGPLEIRADRDRETVSQDFILRGATVAAYVSAEATMLAALRAPEAALLVSNGASTIIDHDPADTTGFLLLPSVRRVEDPAVDSPTTKRWRFEVSYDLPAPSGDSYRREATTALEYTDARQRLVTVTGVYTAGGTATARANHASDFATFATAELTRVASGATFEKITEGPLADDFRSEGVLVFRAVYREVLYTTAVSGLANEQITFARRRQVISSPTRVACVITFSAGVDSSTSPDLDAKWNSVRAALLTKAAALFGATTAIVERETRVPDATGERLAGVLETILVGGSYTYRRRASISVGFDASRRRTVTLTGVYQATDGGDSASTNYGQDIGTWATTALAAADALLSVSSSPTWELIAESPPFDDDDQELAFTRVYREVPHTTSASGVRNEVFGFRRLSSHRHGDPGSTPPVRGVVTFSCNVDKGTSDKDALVGLYTGTIRSALLARLTSQWGGAAIVEDEDVDCRPDSNTITVSMRVLLKGVGSDLVDYGEASTYIRVSQRTWRKLWDGQPDTYHYWSPGHVVLAVVVATSRRLGNGDAEPEGSLPGPPPQTFGASGGGAWLLDQPQTVERAVIELGRGPTSAGSSTVLQTEKTTVTRLRWVAEGSAEVGRATEDGATAPDAANAVLQATGLSV